MRYGKKFWLTNTDGYYNEDGYVPFPCPLAYVLGAIYIIALIGSSIYWDNFTILVAGTIGIVMLCVALGVFGLLAFCLYMFLCALFNEAIQMFKRGE